jgi:formylglycine-generating enzyme required for sulfatase activity
MNNTEKPADRKSSASLFKKVLQAFANGDLPYSDVQSALQRLLATGASPEELREVMQRYQSIEPLPGYAHVEVLRILNEAMERAAALKLESDAAQNLAPDAQSEPAAIPAPVPDTRPTERSPEAIAAAVNARTLPSAAVSAVSAATRPMMGRATARGGELMASPPENVSSIEERIARQRTDYKALNLADERAREASARAAALTTELAAVRNALEAQQTKARMLDKALAESMAAGDAARTHSAETRRELERDRMELRSVRDQLVARNTAIDQLRLSLGERDDQVTALQRDHTSRMAALDTRASAGRQLEAEIQAERARSAALAAELAQARTALESAQRKTREADEALAEKRASDTEERVAREEALRQAERYRVELGTFRESLATRDAAIVQARNSLAERDARLAALQGEHAKLSSTLESRAAKNAQLEADLQASRERALALTADLASAQAAVALEHDKTRETRKALAERTAADEAARSHHEDALRKAEAYRAELSKVRDSLAKRQSEHTKIVATLEARTKALEAQLQAARESPPTQEITVAIERPQREYPPTQEITFTVDPPQRELPPTQEITFAVDPPQLEYPPTQEITVAVDPPQRESQPAGAIAGFDARPTPSIAAPQSKSAAQFPQFPLFGSHGGRGAGAVARVAGVCAAIAVLAVVAWMVVHHAPAPENVPAVSKEPPKPGTVIHDCPTCPALTVVPKGRFKQGSDRAGGITASFEKPPHWVLIGQSFAISTNAVTVDEFRAFIAATGRDMRGCETYDDKWRYRPEASWENPGFVQTGSHPVTCVSWDDAKAYAGWLSTTTGHRYRLPSAADWEYAARSGGEAVQPWNTDGSGACASANVADQRAAHRYPGWTVFACDDGYVYTAPVGSFKANSFGLNDMLGNVFQWTDDCWHADYTGLPTDGSARTYGDCSERELRGGSWFTTPDFVRASYRNHFRANYRASSVGIRLVRDLEP